MRLRGATALVTGSSRGIGRASAIATGRRGREAWRCTTTRMRRRPSTRYPPLQVAATSLLQADLGVDGEARRLVEGTVAALGSVSIVVNNAGIYQLHPPATVDPRAMGGSLDWDAHGQPSGCGPCVLLGRQRYGQARRGAHHQHLLPRRLPRRTGGTGLWCKQSGDERNESIDGEGSCEPGYPGLRHRSRVGGDGYGVAACAGEGWRWCASTESA